MKKSAVLFMLCALLCLSACASAAGVTLRIFTPFADMDFAAQRYSDLITQWETQTGNFAEDYSGDVGGDLADTLSGMLQSGQVDILITPAYTRYTEDHLIPLSALAEAAPQLNVRAFSSMTKKGAQALFTPVRINWEALYINTDVLAANGLSVPASLEELITVCAALDKQGVLPIANALGDWAETTLDCAALSGAPEAAYGSAESFSAAETTVAMLSAVGAFGRHSAQATDAEMMDLFLSGEAAMRFDSDYLAYHVPQNRYDCVTVINPPAVGGAQPALIVGEPIVGAAITRSCFEDEQRREAALSLLGQLLSDPALITPAGGALAKSIAQMTQQAKDCTGLLYYADPDGFDAWSTSVVAALLSQ